MKLVAALLHLMTSCTHFCLISAYIEPNIVYYGENGLVYPSTATPPTIDHASEDAAEYNMKINLGVDRMNRPFSEIDCLFNSRVRWNRSCYLSRKNKPKLKEVSKLHMKPSINRWLKVESTDQVETDPLTDSIIGRDQSSGYYRKKRAALNETDSELEKEMLSHRSKRDIPGNPCTRGPARRSIVTEAIHALNGKPVELFQNPDDRLFQTFFFRPCHIPKFFSFDCEITYVECVAAVYKTNGYDVEVVPIRVPTSCAMSVGR